MNEGLIKAENVIKRLSSLVITDDLYGIGKQDGINYALRVIAEEPFVPERTGRWIEKERHEHFPSGQPYKADYCSLCGKRGCAGYDFCPNCGSRNGEEDGDD
ncbi:MAG: hypothetical protein Q4C22_04160 [Bacillota bacterium]|nr:hypothetical protein [Bacillota bacterium]